MALTRLKISSSNKKSIKSAAVFTGAVLFIFLLGRIPFLRPITQGFQGFLVGVGTRLDQIIFNRSQNEEDWQARAKRAEELSGTLAISQTELLDLRTQVKELQELFDYLQTTPSSGQLARVLSRSTSDEGLVLLNLGSQEGMRPGLAVIVEGGHLVGVVESVYADSCVVRLSTDDHSRVPAAVLGDERTIGLIEGQDGFLLRLGFVTQDQVLTPGQVVATSGLDGSLPAGLIIGVIDSVIKEERAPFQSALVRPLFDSQFYSYVYVLDPS